MNKEKIFLNLDRSIIVCLCILIFCLPFAKAMVGISIGLAAFLWILKRLLGYRTEGPGRLILETDLNKVLGIYIIINLISVIFSVDHGLSLKGFFYKELKFIVIFFMIIEVINSKYRLKSVLFTIIASALLITADAGAQYFRGVDFLKGYTMHFYANLGRITASFLNPNGFAGWLIIIIPLFFGLLVTNKIIGKTLKALISLLVILLFICLLMTYSRAAWLSFIISIFIIVFYCLVKITLKSKIMHLLMGIYLLTALLCLPHPINKLMGKISFSDHPSLNERIKSIAETDQITYLVRANFWKQSLKIIKDYPLFGCGLNTYSKVAKNYKSLEYGEYGEGYPHNSFLQKTAETGFPGLFAFILLMFSFFVVGIQHIFLCLNNNKALAVGLLTGILAFLVQSFFDNNLYALQLVVLFWFMLGLTMAVINIEKQSSV